MLFPRQEYWSELPFPSPWILLTQGQIRISPTGRQILHRQAPWEAQEKVCACSFAQSHSTLCEPLDWSPPGFMSFSRPEYWSGLPFPPPGDLPNLRLVYWQADFFTTEPPGKP